MIDPISLIIAAVVIVMPRYIGYKAALAEAQRQAAAQNSDELQRRRAQTAGGPVGQPGTMDGPPIDVNPDTAKGRPVDPAKNFARDLGQGGFNV